MNVSVDNLIQSAASALSDAEPQENSLLMQTRRLFRRNPNADITSRRGRRQNMNFKKNMFLLRRSNADYYPTKREIDFLTTSGLGKSLLTINRKWSLEELENKIYDSYPRISILRIVGFKYAKLDKGRRIQLLEIMNSVEELEKLCNKGNIIIVPNRDLPLPEEANGPSVEVLIDQFTEPALPPTTSMIILDEVEAVHTEVNYVTDSALETRMNEAANAIMIYNEETSDNFEDESDVDVNDIIFPVVFPETIEFFVNRENIVKDVIDFYSNDDVINKNLHVHFLGELGSDMGGLTKELFTIFWEQVQVDYFRGENIIVPHLPLHRIRKDGNKCKIFGRILTHMSALLKSFPSNFSVITILMIAGHEQFDKNVIFNEFLKFVTEEEAHLLKKSVNNFQLLTANEKESLQSLFTASQFYEVPSALDIKEQITSIAEETLVTKPNNLIQIIRSGIPLQYLNTFWASVTYEDIMRLKKKQQPTVNKVLKCIKTDIDDTTNEQETVLYYFKTYIKSLKNNYEQLLKLLLFITGSTNMPNNITVIFTNLVGLTRRPIVHTCTNTIELSTSYSSYQDFKREINVYLSSDLSFTYSQI